MGLNFEISEPRSAIVVTLSGATELDALRPLRAALAAAMDDGQTVVVNLDNLPHLDTDLLAELLAQAEPVAGQLRLVARRTELLGAIAAFGSDPRIEINPSGTAAVDGPGNDLPAKFANLSDQYRAAIDECRWLLRRLDDATDSTQSGSPEPADGACATERHRDRGERSGTDLQMPRL